MRCLGAIGLGDNYRNEAIEVPPSGSDFSPTAQPVVSPTAAANSHALSRRSPCYTASGLISFQIDGQASSG